MREIEPPKSLIRAALEQRNVALLKQDLFSIAAHLKLKHDNNIKKDDLFMLVARHIFKDDPDAENHFRHLMNQTTSGPVSISEYDQAVMDELISHDADFKADLRDMSASYRKRKSMEENQLRQNLKTERAKTRIRAIAKRCAQMLKPRRKPKAPFFIVEVADTLAFAAETEVGEW